MNGEESASFLQRIKHIIIGKAKDPHDPHLFHKLSLVAFFAWVGLGIDGLSSSCYGPEEAFLALGSHSYLSVFVAIASIITIFVICASYNQIIDLFPSGGGGYLVASRLLSPSVGMISGCALLIDYILTITLSVASGADALFSFLPIHMIRYKLTFAILGVVVLTILNMRGVKESIFPLVPIFLIFLISHAAAIIYIIASKMPVMGDLVNSVCNDISATKVQLGLFGMIALIMKSYSMGAGTYTGIEAVSNGIPILREPKQQTAKQTMRYMSFSLAFMVLGLMIGYLLLNIHHIPGKTLNAALFHEMTRNWNADVGYIFVLVLLVSEAVILFVAAQTGFLGGPRVIGNMALDRWFPSHFALLSERFVIQNGILLMGGASLFLMVLSRGSVRFLVVLYAINVFITFFLSQLGMVRHWWRVRRRDKKWLHGIMVNGIGFMLTTFILTSVTVLKFNNGGWITIFITGSLITLAVVIKSHYSRTQKYIQKLDTIISAADFTAGMAKTHGGKSGVKKKCDTEAKTAVIMVNGYNALGLHTLFNVIRLFADNFKNFIFVEIGILNAGNFNDNDEVNILEDKVKKDLDKYVSFMEDQGYYAEGYSSIGTDVVQELSEVSGKVSEKYKQCVMFGGQVVFPKETFFTRLLYNQTTFVVQRKLYQQGIPFLIMPIRVNE